MNLGILVTTDRHLDHVVGISQAAIAKGNEVVIFTMSEGTRLLEFHEFIQLCQSGFIPPMAAVIT